MSRQFQTVKIVSDCQKNCRLVQDFSKSFALVCSFRYSHGKGVALRPRLAFQAKDHGKNGRITKTTNSIKKGADDTNDTK